MMKNLRTSLLSVSLLLGSTALTSTNVMAGGLNLPGGMKDSVVHNQNAIPIPAPVPMEETASWYLRGDLGINWRHLGDRYYDGDDVDIDMDEAIALRGGFGYYFSNNLRGDLTVDYVDQSREQNQRNEIFGSQDLSTTSVMASLYYDFKPKSVLSPYVGGGIGWASNRLKPDGATYPNLSSDPWDFRQIHSIDVNTGDRVYSETRRKGYSQDTSNFAVAAMAGLNVALRSNLFLDIGYRYQYVGGAKARYYEKTEIFEQVTVNGTQETFRIGEVEEHKSLKIDDIHHHQLMVGLRYDLY